MSILGNALFATKNYNKVRNAYAESGGDLGKTVNNLTGGKLDLSNIQQDTGDKYPTFSMGDVKSTVKNPSKKYKGISVEDEKKIDSLVEKYKSGASNMEKNQFAQGLYQIALDDQKAKDIEEGRQEVIIEYTNKAKNAKSTKEKNTYMSEVKKANLADLIKQHYSDLGYNTKNLNLTDDGIIAGFVEQNPVYEDIINKYFYSDDDAIKLGKDLGWIKKTGWDKTKDKIEGFATNFAGFMPKFGEGVKDALDLTVDKLDTGNGTLNESAFANFVQDKYGTYPAALTDADYKKAREEFEGGDKKEYTPTISSAATKIAEGGTDIAFTTFNPSTLAWRAGFAGAAETPGLSWMPELLGETQGLVGRAVNSIPGFSNIRDSLQSEKEKADWDAFVGGSIWSATKKGKQLNDKYIKNVNIKDLKTAFDKAREGNFKESIEGLKETAEKNYKAKIEAKKEVAAQKVSQVEIENRKSASNGLDILNEEGKLKNIKKLEDLDKATNETIEKLKKEQTDLAKNDNKKYGENDLVIEEEIPVTDAAGNKTTQKKVNRSFSKLLDSIIEYYDDVDPSKAETYKSYRRTFKEGNLPTDVALEIKREGNIINQENYSSKNLIKDTAKAEKWGKMIENVNKTFEKLDIGEELRNKDQQLSNLYTLRSGLRNINKAASNLEKKAMGRGVVEKASSRIGSVVKHFLSTLTLGTSDITTKAVMSFLRSFAEGGEGKTTYTAAEIKAKIPEFVKDWKRLNDKIDGKSKSKYAIKKFIDEWSSKRETTSIYNSNDIRKKKKTQ